MREKKITTKDTKYAQRSRRKDFINFYSSVDNDLRFIPVYSVKQNLKHEKKFFSAALRLCEKNNMKFRKDLTIYEKYFIGHYRSFHYGNDGLRSAKKV